ncbi:hypothetical protein TWF718_001042 [Orbilia javanica]|uniref:Ricin B lectin domain-containing protein n=1 Tax=Orbilia javanica TaxID=47235 RepID=A0AAN8RGY2_9PEZI
MTLPSSSESRDSSSRPHDSEAWETTSTSTNCQTPTDSTINTPTSSLADIGSFIRDAEIRQRRPQSTSSSTGSSTRSGTRSSTNASIRSTTSTSARSRTSARTCVSTTTDTSSSSGPSAISQPLECPSCRRLRLIRKLAPFALFAFSILCAPIFIPFLKPNKGTSFGVDSPWPGSVYIITEGNSAKALTFMNNGIGEVKLTGYRNGNVNQMWTCHEADGWLSFAHTATYGSPVYLGYRPWPSDATLYCDARSARFNEQFEVRSRPRGGFQLRLRNGYGLEPVGRSGKMLSRVRRGSPEVWWRFTKVANPNPCFDILTMLLDLLLVLHDVLLGILAFIFEKLYDAVF